VAALLAAPALPAGQAPARPEVEAFKPGKFDWQPERAPSGPVVVIVSLPDQQAYVYRNGIRIGRTSVSTGRPGHLTPTGTFTILQKDKDHRSTIYNDAPMPYMQRLTWGGVALHAGGLPGYPSSHGCVHLPLEFSKRLFEITGKGTTVVIADAHTASVDTLHPGLLLASANLDDNPALKSLPEPAGEMLWTPEAVPDGPIGILVSGADRTVYVQRNGVLIGRAGLTILQPERPLADGVYVMLDRAVQTDSTLVPGRPTHWWQAIALEEKDGPILSTNDLAARVKLPPGFAAKVYDIVAPGTTLMVTGRTATGFTTTPADFTVLAADTPEPKP
jgi:hypothetical protein